MPQRDEMSSQPFWARALYKMVTAMRHVLPARLYSLFYEGAFRAYKVAYRAFYLRWLLYYSLRADWRGVKKAKVIHRVMSNSLVGPGGLSATYDAVEYVEQNEIEGCLVECGVARGGSAGLMGMVSSEYGKSRKMWLFDSFEGLPDPTPADYMEDSTGKHLRPLPQGSCLGTYENVESFLFDDLSLDRDSVSMVKGWFQDTLPECREEIGAISLLRIDGDWYESTKCCLEELYESVVTGGYVLIDDYGTCYGCKKAVDEFLAARNLQGQFISDGRGGVLFRKPA